ncbi:hypothetical protein [uncultured Psychroserpens sp.]|uniref:hypothetical protein n=1 Tax=uncultured Psychroserpens sp. TaxID=255436 RepID=UPI002619960A|nr:hypothetical protein [uncultured Psychroserpens sp.]
MKNLITLFILFFTIQIQAQNWIGNENFVDLYEQSDVVLIGVITKIENLKQDTTKTSPFKMPLKNMTLASISKVKGNTDKTKIYYKDIFNGCGYAPVLYENVESEKTIIFGKIKNDSIFQIGSMNESPIQIAKALTEFDKIKSDINSANFTNWFCQTAKNKDLFELLNNNITFEQEPIYSKLNMLKFSTEQRNELYDVIDSFERYDYDNEGIVSILVKYKDQRLKTILKEFIIGLRKEPYSGIDDLMEYYYQITENEKLQKLINEFDNDSRMKERIKVINEFINEI